MKYLAALIMPFFILSCALEKESSDTISGVFSFTTASVGINNISNGSNTYTLPPACINFLQGDGVIRYTIKSSGHYGSNYVDALIRNSYLRITRARIYLNDAAIDIPAPQDIKYNAEVTQEVALTKSMIDAAQITDGTYTLSLEIVASEYNGNDINTALNESFSSYFGAVTISSIGQGCQ